MRKFIYDHALTFAVIIVYLTMLITHIILSEKIDREWFANLAGGHSDDAFGACIIVIVDKLIRLREKGVF